MRRYVSMKRSNLTIFLVILMLITTVMFMPELKAQDTEQNSANVQEFVKKAQEHVERNEIEEAIELYERIVVAAPEDVESRVQLATLYSRTKQYENAAVIYNKLLETDPENIKYQDELVNSLQAAGKNNEAVEIAQTYVQTYPEVGVHYARLARTYDADGNEPAAIENYKKATTFGYGDKKTYLRLAEHYFLNEDLTATEVALKNAILSSTSRWDRGRIERQLVNLYRYQGNFEEMLQKAEADGTLTFEMQKERARHFRNTGELEKAAIHYQKALEMNNSSFDRKEIAGELLNIYSKQNRTDLVLDYYESEISKKTNSTSTTLSPNGITIRFGHDNTRKVLIDAYKNRGQLEELKTIFEGKLEKDVNNRTVLEMLAVIYWETKDYQTAAETYHTLTKTEQMDRRNIRNFYHAAAAFHNSNQPDMAKVVLHQVNTALASSNYKQDSSFLGALATICLDNKMSDPALKLAADAVSEAKASNDNWELEYLYEILAKSYLAVQRYEDVFETYQQMINLTKEGYNSSMKERAESGMKEAAKAGNLYEKWIPEQLKLVEENPNDTKHILQLAQYYEASEKIKEAIAQYIRLTELESEKSQWHKKLGDLYQNLPQEIQETGTVSEVLNPEQLAKSINSYEKAIELEPTSYNLYDQLAKTYMKYNRSPDAEKVYHRVLDAPLSIRNHESAVQAIARFYTDEGQEVKLIAILEEFKPKMDQSPVLLELLGDLYKKVGDTDKAKLAYDKWLQIRQKALNRTQSAYSFRDFADKLLDKGLYPDVALKFAKRAFHKSDDSYYLYPTILGRACVANGLYDEALRHFKHALSLIFDEYYSDMFWEIIAETNNNAHDKERYIQMLNELIDFIPLASSNARANIYRTMAEFYAEDGMPEKAENYLLNVGFIPETAWITLGQFDNKDSVALYTAYIPEETTQIDTTAKYYGKDKLIRWQKLPDDKVNGMIWLGKDIDWTATYAWTIVSSPDKRDITIRFDSDDQGIIWLNGQEVFRHDRMSGAQVDRYTVPVTLQQGENTILVKVCNATSDTYYFMRLTDTDGNPYKDLKFKNVNELLNAPPPKPTFHVNVNLGMAEYYSKNNMPDKAMEQMLQTGMIHENAWLVLGPFDNTAGIGYNTKYISEDITQIDTTVKYEGVNEQINWEKLTDDAFDGFIDFGEDINWRVSYAMATVTSPDEREVLFRFSSDDQAKIWLNGTEVFTDANAQTAILDKNTIPVTLKAGKNTILVKVCNEEMSWGFYLRITNADGIPFEDLKIKDVQDD